MLKGGATTGIRRGSCMAGGRGSRERSVKTGQVRHPGPLSAYGNQELLAKTLKKK